MGEADWLVLNGVGEVNAPPGPVAKQMLIKWQMLARRDQQDIADSRQHKNRQWVVDHRFVVDCQKLLVDGDRRRIKPGARATGKNDALHHMLFLLSKRPIVSARACRHGRSSMPNSRTTAAQSSLVSVARSAGVGYSLDGIGTISG